MEHRTEILNQNGDEITLRLIDQLQTKTLLDSHYKGRFFGVLDTYEHDRITEEQRKHLFALFGDFESYTGTPLESVESYFKVKFMQEQDLDELPSLKRNAMSKEKAGEFISYVIDFCIQNDIPFRKQQFYLTTDTSKMLYALTMKRICWVTGKPHADIHHASNLVGMGNKRSQHNHEESTFMSLSRESHNEIHQIGYKAFCDKYHVKAIKLNSKELKQLGVM